MSAKARQRKRRRELRRCHGKGAAASSNHIMGLAVDLAVKDEASKILAQTNEALRAMAASPINTGSLRRSMMFGGRQVGKSAAMASFLASAGPPAPPSSGAQGLWQMIPATRTAADFSKSMHSLGIAAQQAQVSMQRANRRMIRPLGGMMGQFADPKLLDDRARQRALEQAPNDAIRQQLDELYALDDRCPPDKLLVVDVEGTPDAPIFKPHYIDDPDWPAAKRRADERGKTAAELIQRLVSSSIITPREARKQMGLDS